MEKRKITERDLNKIVKKVLEEGSTWEGVKGWFKGRGYNYSKYLFEIDETLTDIRKKIVEDASFMSKLTEIDKGLMNSSADKWQKEDEEKNKMRKVIKRVAFKNQRLLTKYKEEHPGCNYSESKYSDQYSKIIIEAMGGVGDNDAEKEDKIIQKIAKEVVIDKKFECIE